jgi:hypothetical protein
VAPAERRRRPKKERLRAGEGAVSPTESDQEGLIMTIWKPQVLVGSSQLNCSHYLRGLIDSNFRRLRLLAFRQLSFGHRPVCFWLAVVWLPGLGPVVASIRHFVVGCWGLVAVAIAAWPTSRSLLVGMQGLWRLQDCSKQLVED